MPSLRAGELGHTEAPTGTHKTQDSVWAMPDWARLQHVQARAGTAGGPWQYTQDPRLRTGLVGEPWGLLYWAAAPTGKYKSQARGRQHPLALVRARMGMGQAKLNHGTCQFMRAKMVWASWTRLQYLMVSARTEDWPWQAGPQQDSQDWEWTW